MQKTKSVTEATQRTAALLTRAEVSRRLGVTPNTLARWAAERTGPPFVKFGSLRCSRVRYLEDGLEEFIRQHVVTAKG